MKLTGKPIAICHKSQDQKYSSPDDITVSGPPFIFRGEYVNLFSVRMTALSPVC
jgi:hypothetical protein